MPLLIRKLLAAVLLLCVPMVSLPSTAQPTVTEAAGIMAEARELDALFRKGVAALDAAGRVADREEREAFLDQAIEAFRTILILQPGLTRVRLELARSFFLKGEDSLAQRQFEQVLAGELPPPVIANINGFLGIMRARRRWEAHVGFAVAPDSNLNTASGETTIWLDTPFGRLPFTRSEEDTAPRSTIGISMWGGGEYQYPLGDRTRLRVGANASIRQYKGREFDSHSTTVHFGPRWLASARTEASLLGTIQRQWSAGRPESDQYGFGLESQHRVSPVVNVQTRLGLRRRNNRGSENLDGPVGEVALTASWVALPILRFSGNTGYSWARAKEKEWRNAGPRAGLGGNVTLPLGFTLGAELAKQWTDYEGNGAQHHTIDQKHRKDRLRTVTLSGYNRGLTLLGFSPRISLINERRRSNAQGLEYVRNRGELSFVRQF